MTQSTKIAILTGGGDCPGLNAAIRGITKAAIQDYGIKVVGILDGFRGLVENRTIPLGYEDMSGVLTLGGTILGTSRDKPRKIAEAIVERIPASAMIDGIEIAGPGFINFFVSDVAFLDSKVTGFRNLPPVEMPGRNEHAGLDPHGSGYVDGPRVGSRAAHTHRRIAHRSAARRAPSNRD